MKKIFSLFVLIFVMTMANVMNAKAENMNAQSCTSTVRLCVIVCTINGFRESYSLENGQANIQAFIPIPSGKTAPMVYISVK